MKPNPVNLAVTNIIASFLLLFLLQTASATTYLEAYSTGVVQPGENITISGQIANSSTSDVIAGINVSAVVESNSGYNVTPSSGVFNFNVTAPTEMGSYNVTISTNESTPKSKAIPIYVSNMSTGNITYVDKSPPFSVGTTFIINVTLVNGTTPVASYTPNISIYELNGPPISWTISNGSTASDANGVINYTVTVPSTATSGQYVIVVENGVLTSVFSVKSGYMVLVNTETTNEETRSTFAPGSDVMILAKVKTSAGVAVSSGVSSVTAYVTLPNGTVQSVSLTARNQTTYPGYYNNSFTTDASLRGTYQITIDAVIGSSTIQSYTFLQTRTFSVELEEQTNFFMEWGGTAAFGVGDTVGFNIVALNLSTGEILTVDDDITACNVSYLAFADVFSINGTSVNSSITNAEFATGQYIMNSICKVQFTGPSTSGIYGIKVNLTIGGITETAEEYFSIQKYFLKSAVILDLGGEFEFEKMVSPGENITISLSAYNISSDADVDGSLIQNVTVTKITPLEFGRTEITSDINYSVSYGTNPTITLGIPSSMMGPTSVDIQANISGETVIGNAFFMANYLSGFMSPVAGGMSGGAGGEGGGGPPFSSCSGIVAFTGTISETKTSQAVSAGSVVISQIVEVTEEMTGKDVTDCITLTDAGTSGSQGSMTINVTFSDDCSLSGFYFMILNASYEGKTSGIPTPFMCKNLNFWPNIYSVGGDDATWNIAPTSGVKMSIANITRLNDSQNIGNGTVTIPFVFNFNPGTGERMLSPTSAFNSFLQSLTLNFTRNQTTNAVIQNNITFDIYPQNFTLVGESNTLTAWPNGFIDLQPTVCTEDLSDEDYPWSDGCDTGMSGFQVVAFDAWVESFPWGQSMSVNSSQSFVISAKTNVSRSSLDHPLGSVYNSSNNTAFTVKLGKPWQGSMTAAQNVTATLISDEWNSTRKH